MMTKEKAFLDNKVSFPVYYLKDRCFDFPGAAGQRLVITLLQRGSCVISCGSERYILAAPAVVMINEDAVLHCGESCEYVCESICFHPSFINVSLDFHNIRTGRGLNLTELQDSFLFRIFAENPDSFTTIHLNSLNYHECATYFERFAEAMENRSGFLSNAREVLISFLIFLKGIEQTENRAIDLQIPANDYRLEEIILYLYAHYDEEMTINSIASEFGTNRTTLNLRFKKVIGCTVMRLLRTIRMNMAARLLRSSSKTVSEISFETGFQDISNFGKLFRQTFGCAPSSYRSMYGSSTNTAAMC
ncbi:MAG: helix-turn-helix transcriptional regulator [Spirochaetales bacterium]|nr:helix-turn-helix transcriptional regulator [Spirochaetales bacterium]